MKTLAIVVTTPPYSPLTITAINYVKAAIKADITVIGVFFYLLPFLPTFPFNLPKIYPMQICTLAHNPLDLIVKVITLPKNNSYIKKAPSIVRLNI